MYQDTSKASYRVKKLLFGHFFQDEETDCEGTKEEEAKNTSLGVEPIEDKKEGTFTLH